VVFRNMLSLSRKLQMHFKSCSKEYIKLYLRKEKQAFFLDKPCIPWWFLT